MAKHLLDDLSKMDARAWLATLAPGQSFEGTAIIDAETTTIIVNEGDRVTVNPLGWLDIKLANNRNVGGEARNSGQG